MASTRVTWKGHRVLVTGGGGFIGSALARELLRMGAAASVLDLQRANLDVWGLDRVDYHRADLRDPAAVDRVVEACRPDLVFHLAAESQVLSALEDPTSALDTNVRGTWNLLDSCRKRNVPRIVVASSDKAYGIQHSLPYTEAQPVQASFVYDTSKACTDLVAQAYARSFDMQVAIVRCGNVFGPGDLNWDRIVPHVIRSVVSGQRPVLRSDGRPRRDYVYLDDAVSAYVSLAAAMERRRMAGEAFNFGTGNPVSVVQIVDTLLGLLQRPDLRPAAGPKAAREIPDQYLSSEKASTELGWSARTTLAEGLAKTVEWYRAFLARPLAV